MKTIPKYIFLLMTFLLIANVSWDEALADHNDHKERGKYQKRIRLHSNRNDKRNLIPVNSAYGENCGACHFAYQAELLPSKAWEKIFSDLNDHFGEVIELDPESKKIISEYLLNNAADISSSKFSGKIMKSLGNLIPQRVTEVPYILKEHHEINSEVFKRDSVGSISNCSACHKTAEQGIYDDDYVSIPR